jgi:hypothetical protein
MKINIDVDKRINHVTEVEMSRLDKLIIKSENGDEFTIEIWASDEEFYVKGPVTIVNNS